MILLKKVSLLILSVILFLLKRRVLVQKMFGKLKL